MKKLCKPHMRLMIAWLMILILVVASCTGCTKQGGENGAESAKENEIVENETNVPIFIGVVNSVAK